MAVYEGKWRCPVCKSVNPGRLLNCASCGHKADESVEYFLDDNPAEVTDPALSSFAGQNENWICSSCDGYNRANDIECSGCGNHRDSSDKTLASETRENFTDWRERPGAKSASPPLPVRQYAVPPPPRPSYFTKPKNLVGLIIVGVILFNCTLCGAISSLTPSPNKAVNSAPVKLAASTNSEDSVNPAAAKVGIPPRVAQIEVVDLEWQTSTAIEEYKTFTETGWKDDVPAGAKILEREQVVRSTEKVQVGTKTVYESYTETVRDGDESYTDTVRDGDEIYTDTVSAGEESYKCGVINKKNGFFEDKYCSRTKYKTVTRTRPRYKTVTKNRPRYKTVTKTRPKQEPVYEDKPIYDTQITYEIKRWTTVNTAENNGHGWQPTWSKVTVPKGDRIGEKTGHYKVVFHETEAPQNTYWKEIQLPELKDFSQGKKFTAKINEKGELLSIDATNN